MEIFKEVTMSVAILDAKGLKCPQPTIQMTIKALKLKQDDVLEVIADCSTFENDVRTGAAGTRKPFSGSMMKGTASGVARSSFNGMNHFRVISFQGYRLCG